MSKFMACGGLNHPSAFRQPVSTKAPFVAVSTTTSAPVAVTNARAIEPPKRPSSPSAISTSKRSCSDLRKVLKIILFTIPLIGDIGCIIMNYRLRTEYEKNHPAKSTELSIRCLYGDQMRENYELWLKCRLISTIASCFFGFLIPIPIFFAFSVFTNIFLMVIVSGCYHYNRLRMYHPELLQNIQRCFAFVGCTPREVSTHS